jgi:pyrimidine operon attenuation protein/uracil phosphoribosyltransferase
MGMEKVICEADIVNSAIEKIADAIIKDFCSKEKNEEFALVGLFKQGVPLSCRIAEIIEKKCNIKVPLAALDISMYRDDFGLRSALPLINETVIPFDMDMTNIILVDDVLSTGRTIRAALDAVTDYGRPSLIRLAVLVDRGNVEYPIRADYAGMNLNVDADKKIKVEFTENDGVDRISEIKWK